MDEESRRVLVVDDEQEILDVVKERLEAASYEVITSRNGTDGRAKAREEKPDLILMDIMMPDMSGGDAVRALKSDASTRDIPVIFLSAVVSAKEGGEGSIGINVAGINYPAIAKPFDSQKLLDEVSKHINLNS